MLITTFGLKRVAVYYGDALLPFCAIDETGSPLHGCELFGDANLPFLVVQISSMFVAKSYNDGVKKCPERQFIAELAEFLAKETGGRRLTVVNVTSGSAASLSDPDLRLRVAHYSVNADVSDAESEHFVRLGRRSFQRDSSLFHLPEAGFSHTLARFIASRRTQGASRTAYNWELRVLAVFADQGDCRMDAARLSEAAWHVLHAISEREAGNDERFKHLLALPTPVWRAPARWAAVYDEMLP